MKNNKSFTVRIMPAYDKPSIVQTKVYHIPHKSLAVKFLEKTLHFLVGSGSGLVAGAVIYLLLLTIGINFTGLESSLIIGIPSLLGLITTLITY